MSNQTVEGTGEFQDSAFAAATTDGMELVILLSCKLGHFLWLHWQVNLTYILGFSVIFPVLLLDADPCRVGYLVHSGLLCLMARFWLHAGDRSQRSWQS